MEDCLKEAVRGLFRSCLDEDQSRRKQAITIATLACICLKRDYGAEKAIGLFRLSVEEHLHHVITSLETTTTPASSTSSTSPQSFWSRAEHLHILTSSTPHTPLRPLHQLHITLTHLITSLAHCTHTAFGQEEDTKLLGVVCSHMIRELLKRKSTRTVDTMESLLEDLALLHTIVDVAGEHCMGDEMWTEVEQFRKEMVSKAPKLIHKEYMEGVRREGELVSAQSVLESVTILTDGLFLLATITKMTTTVQDVVIEATLQLCNHCLEHLVQLQKSFPEALSLKSLYIVFNSALCLEAMYRDILKQLDFHQQDFSSQLAVNLTDCCDGFRERIVSYHVQLCQSSLLQDKDSNDWTSNQPFHEDERCSFSIQMWYYHMQALKQDLYTTVHSNTVSKSVLVEVLGCTLSFLAARYRLITPTHKRVKQARADILSILLSTAYLLSSYTQLCSDHTHIPTSIHQCCNSLLATLSVKLSPLVVLKDNLTASLLERSTTTTTGEWLSFLKQCKLYPLTIHGRHVIDQSDCTSSVGTSKDPGVLLAPYSYHHDRSSWPKLLQSLCEDVSLAVKVCGCEGVEHVTPHMVLILAHCYHSPHSLSLVYSAMWESCMVPDDPRKLSEEGRNSFNFQQAATSLIADMLQEYMLLKVGGLYHKSTDKDKEIEGALSGLVEEVSCLPAPLLHLIHSIADSEGNVHLPLGRRVAKVLADILGAWLTTLHPHLAEPLLSTVINFNTILTRSLTHSSRQQSPWRSEFFKQLEELFSSHDSEMGVASIEEHRAAIQAMEQDSTLIQSLQVVSDCFQHPPTAFNPLNAHNTIAGIAMETIMDKTEDIKWNDLFKRLSVTHTDIDSLVARRWELQESSQSLLTGEETTLVQTIRTVLSELDDTSV